MSAACKRIFSLLQFSWKGRRKCKAEAKEKQGKTLGKARQGRQGCPQAGQKTVQHRSKQQTCCFLETDGCMSASQEVKHYKFLAACSLVVASPRASRVWFLFEQAIF